MSLRRRATPTVAKGSLLLLALGMLFSSAGPAGAGDGFDEFPPDMNPDMSHSYLGDGSNAFIMSSRVEDTFILKTYFAAAFGRGCPDRGSGDPWDVHGAHQYAGWQAEYWDYLEWDFEVNPLSGSQLGAIFCHYGTFHFEFDYLGQNFIDEVSYLPETWGTAYHGLDGFGDEIWAAFDYTGISTDILYYNIDFDEITGTPILWVQDLLENENGWDNYGWLYFWPRTALGNPSAWYEEMYVGTITEGDGSVHGDYYCIPTVPQGGDSCWKHSFNYNGLGAYEVFSYYMIVSGVNSYEGFDGPADQDQYGNEINDYNMRWRPRSQVAQKKFVLLSNEPGKFCACDIDARFEYEPPETVELPATDCDADDATTIDYFADSANYPEALLTAVDICDLGEDWNDDGNPDLKALYWDHHGTIDYQPNGSTWSGSVGVLYDYGPSLEPQRGHRMLMMTTGEIGEEVSVEANSRSWESVVDNSYQYVDYALSPPNTVLCPEDNCDRKWNNNRWDVSLVEFEVDVPDEANSFSYDVLFFTSEFPEYTGWGMNDGFEAVVESVRATDWEASPDYPGYVCDDDNNGVYEGNVAFDGSGNPLKVNNDFVTRHGCADFNGIIGHHGIPVVTRHDKVGLPADQGWWFSCREEPKTHPTWNPRWYPAFYEPEDFGLHWYMNNVCSNNRRECDWVNYYDCNEICWSDYYQTLLHDCHDAAPLPGCQSQAWDLRGICSTACRNTWCPNVASTAACCPGIHDPDDPNGERENSGGTYWLRNVVPVQSGETIKVTFRLYDRNQANYDTVVLIDNWQWSSDDYEAPYLFEPPHDVYLDPEWTPCQDGEDCDEDGYCGGSDPCDDPADTPGDCNDYDPNVYPGAPEICNSYDDDCNLVADHPGEMDLDGDGYLTCGGPLDDCDDANSEVYPGAPEIPCNDLDDDCSGGDLEILDADGDGYYSDECDCAAPADCSMYGDCNDDPYDPNAPNQNPGLIEQTNPLCTNNFDDDCDGDIDGADSGCPSTCNDMDMDGYGSPGDWSCDSGSPEEDCDDGDPNIHPGAYDGPDGIDNDCDGWGLMYELDLNNNTIPTGVALWGDLGSGNTDWWHGLWSHRWGGRDSTKCLRVRETYHWQTPPYPTDWQNLDKLRVAGFSFDFDGVDTAIGQFKLSWWHNYWLQTYRDGVIPLISTDGDDTDYAHVEPSPGYPYVINSWNCCNSPSCSNNDAASTDLPLPGPPWQNPLTEIGFDGHGAFTGRQDDWEQQSIEFAATDVIGSEGAFLSGDDLFRVEYNAGFDCKDNNRSGYRLDDLQVWGWDADGDQRVGYLDCDESDDTINVDAGGCP